MSIKELEERCLAELDKPRTNWRKVQEILHVIYRKRAQQQDWRPSEFAMTVSQEIPLIIKKLKALKARHRAAMQSLIPKGA